MFERLMRTAGGGQISDGDRHGRVFATDDVISKTMGENVLPGIMKQHGVDLKLSVDFPPAGRSTSRPQVLADDDPARTDLVAVGLAARGGDQAGPGDAPPGP